MFHGSGRGRVDEHIDRLRSEYGAFEVVYEETVVSRKVYADCVRAAEARTLGGARVFVRTTTQHPAGVVLLRYSYAPEVWDLPGGATTRGDSFSETATRHARVDAGVTCEFTGVSHVLRQTFTLVEGGDGVTGLWVFFDAETDSELSPDDDVLEASWFDPRDPPSALGPQIDAQLDEPSAD